MIQKRKAFVIASATIPVLLLTVGFGLRAFAAAPDADVEKVYLDKCSVCHGADGAGKTAKGKKLNVKDVRSPEVQKMSEAQLADIIVKGKGKDMDGFEKELGKDTCEKLAAYMHDLSKK
jgi:mono/diheme cytochrome c family protein